MTDFRVKQRQLAKLREFRKGDDVEEFLSTQYRQVLRALENMYVSVDGANSDDSSGSSFVTSSTCGNFTTAITADVTNLSVTITTSGGNIKVGLLADGLFSAQIGVTNNSSGCSADFLIVRSGTTIASYQVGTSAGGSSSTSVIVPSSAFSFVDRNVAAGTYTYKITAVPAIGTAIVRNSILYAYED